MPVYSSDARFTSERRCMGVRTLCFCWVPWTAAALLSPVTPPTAVSSRHLAETLQSLDHALETLQRGDAAGGDPAPLVNACLAVCRALPGAQGDAAIPEDAVMLREAAAFFDWESADELGQHLFDASLWDDALEALARAVSRADCELAVEAAAAVMASARFVLLAPEARHVTTHAPDGLQPCNHPGGCPLTPSLPRHGPTPGATRRAGNARRRRRVRRLHRRAQASPRRRQAAQRPALHS